MNDVLGVAVVGCGAISLMHLKAIEDMPMAKLEIVCDKNIEKAKQVAAAYGCDYTNDYRSLLNKQK